MERRVFRRNCHPSPLELKRKATLPNSRLKGGSPPPRSDHLAKLDLPSNLPQKDGKVDMGQYAKYKPGGLRQKIHEAIRAKQCIRCWSSDHLRSSCPEPPKSWEDDFNKGKAAFWGPKPKQSRPQWLRSPPPQPTPLDLSPTMLFARHEGLILALDTCSEVSIGRKDLLKGLRLAKEPICLEGIGGTRGFCLEGDFSLGENFQITVFGVEKGDLPPGVSILLGNRDLIDLGLSLDYVQGHPGCLFSEALFCNLQHGWSGRRHFVPDLFSPVDVSFALFWPALSLMASFVILAMLVSFGLFSPAQSGIEPRALLEVSVCLFACRFAWICPEVFLSFLVSALRPLALAKHNTTPQVPRGTLSSLSSHLPPADLRDAPTAFAYHDPTLSPSPANRFGGVRSRFSSLLKAHRAESLPRSSRLVARRAFPTPPSRKNRQPRRA